jgi:hypothetical protein
VAAYINEDVLDPELLVSPPSRVPTETEITEILAPWRPQKLRRIAAAYLAENSGRYKCCLLRTHYGGGTGHDATLRDWLNLGGYNTTEPNINPEDKWHAVLNDPALFGFGDDWRRAYTVLPELAARVPDRRFTDKHVEKVRELATSYTKRLGDVDDKGWEDYIIRVAVSGSGWLLVLDEDAFETWELGLILRDAKGNLVKEGTIKSKDLGYFPSATAELGWLSQMPRWKEAAVGKKYRTGGSIMRQLLPRVK